MKILFTFLISVYAIWSLPQFAMSYYNPVETSSQAAEQKRIAEAGIKTIYARSINYSESGEDFSTQVYSYSRDGKIEEEKYYYQDTILFQTLRTFYDSQGRKILSDVVGKDFSIRNETEYRYDPFGNFIPSGHDLICDDQNRPVQFVKINENKRRICLEYNDSGKVVTIRNKYADAYEDVDSFVYDQNNRVTKIYAIHYSYFHLYPNGKDSLITEQHIKYVITRMYDNQGNLTWSFNSGLPEAEYKAEYDSLNRKIKSWQGNSRKEFDYDTDGNLLSVREFVEGEMIRITFYSYDFW